MEESLQKIRQAFRDDPAYAHTWHDNIAVQIMDEGVSHKIANQAATRIMRHCFDVETVPPSERSR